MNIFRKANEQQLKRDLSRDFQGYTQSYELTLNTIGHKQQSGRLLPNGLAP